MARERERAERSERDPESLFFSSLSLLSFLALLALPLARPHPLDSDATPRGSSRATAAPLLLEAEEVETLLPFLSLSLSLPHKKNKKKIQLTHSFSARRPGPRLGGRRRRLPPKDLPAQLRRPDHQVARQRARHLPARGVQDV